MKLFDLVNDRLRKTEGHPRIMAEAMKLFGTHETIGAGDNPTIVGWAVECGLADQYHHDATPWCGLFASVCVKRAAYKFPARPLWALNWASWGSPTDVPMFGDVLVFTRPGGGHVGFYAAEEPNRFWVLGGNEADQVEFTPIAKSRMAAFRRPPYVIPPASVRRVLIQPMAAGEVTLA